MALGTGTVDSSFCGNACPPRLPPGTCRPDMVASNTLSTEPAARSAQLVLKAVILAHPSVAHDLTQRRRHTGPVTPSSEGAPTSPEVLSGRPAPSKVLCLGRTALVRLGLAGAQAPGGIDTGYVRQGPSLPGCRPCPWQDGPWLLWASEHPPLNSGPQGACPVSPVTFLTQ